MISSRASRLCRGTWYLLPHRLYRRGMQLYHKSENVNYISFSSSSKISRKFGPSRRVIESSDSEDADEHNVAANEVIELTDDDEPAPINLPLPSRSRSPSKPSGVHRHRNLYADLDDTDLDDSDASPPSPLRDAAILVLCEGFFSSFNQC